jgi:hypothetical protein
MTDPYEAKRSRPVVHAGMGGDHNDAKSQTQRSDRGG